jgi:hypothetical protein
MHGGMAARVAQLVAGQADSRNHLALALYFGFVIPVTICTGS